MKRLSVLMVAVLCAVLVALAVLPASAEENSDIENAISFKEVTESDYRNNGVRAVFSVSRNTVTKLEQNYKVAYGAITAVGEYRGQTVNDVSALTVSGSFAEGYTAEQDHARAVVVYATGDASYATGKHADSGRTSFSCTTVMDELTADACGAGLVYAAFIAVTDQSGNQTIVYDYAENELFGSDDAKCGKSLSMLELATYLVNEYDDHSLKAYCYTQSASLRAVLTLGGVTPRVLDAPISLREFQGELSLSKTLPTEYLKAARAAYVTDEYADYTTSIVGNYSTSSSSHNDIPRAATLRWYALSSGKCSYRLLLSDKEDFSSHIVNEVLGINTYDVYNLKTGSTYYWKVQAYTSDGYFYETPVSVLKTAEGVRWIYAEGARNVRDIGGWNGLNQGLVYRGSELNSVKTHGLQLTDVGVKTMTKTLGMKTDLDFRAVGDDCGNITMSPMGEGVAFTQIPIGNFMSLYSSDSFSRVMKVFANYDNYPIYMHCWGGADRTGTVAFMLEGLCGVSEEDLAIDLELTSFASFGYRYRYDNGAYIYASMMNRMKQYDGDTLQQKFEKCARTTLGLSVAEISNIQAINTMSGGVFLFAEGENGDVYFDHMVDSSVSFAFAMRESTDVVSLAVDGVSLSFSFDKEYGILTVSGEELLKKGIVSGVGVITFDDGSYLRFFIETTLVEETASKIVNGDYSALFGGESISFSDQTVTGRGNIAVSTSASYAILRYGYESMTFTIRADSVETPEIRFYDLFGNELSDKTKTLTTADGTLSSQTVTIFFSSDARICLDMGESATVTLSDIKFNKTGTAWAESIQNGAYGNLFPIGKEGTDANGDPTLTVSKNTNPNAPVGDFSISNATVQKARRLGYTQVTFTVDVVFPAATNGCYLSVVSDGKKLEKTVDTLSSATNRVTATVTVALGDTNITFVTRTCSLSGGIPDLDRYTDVDSAVITFSDVRLS